MQAIFTQHLSFVKDILVKLLKNPEMAKPEFRFGHFQEFFAINSTGSFTSKPILCKNLFYIDTGRIKLVYIWLTFTNTVNFSFPGRNDLRVYQPCVSTVFALSRAIIMIELSAACWWEWQKSNYLEPTVLSLSIRVLKGVNNNRGNSPVSPQSERSIYRFRMGKQRKKYEEKSKDICASQGYYVHFVPYKRNKVDLMPLQKESTSQTD